jgi:hypothetical protein
VRVQRASTTDRPQRYSGLARYAMLGRKVQLMTAIPNEVTKKESVEHSAEQQVPPSWCDWLENVTSR